MAPSADVSQCSRYARYKMKVSGIILALSAILVAVLADAPLDYSTTQQDAFAPPSVNAPSSSYGVPSSSYGPPSSRRQTAAVLRPSANYGAPPPSSSYGAPGGGHRGSTNFGSAHGGRNRGSFRPSPSYGAPSTGYGAPSTGYGGGRGGHDDGSTGPASYQFSYHVQDAASGNDFGHQESREGHQATGMYMVLLPDGRRQIVEYTADESGYHPIVRYEGTARASTGGYPSGPSGSGGSGGYRY